ncbi:MAG TPA: amidohydrolase [Mycobacteriales bacterium]|nr:amidohydrolase [Mycobacteriales bacterium]
MNAGTRYTCGAVLTCDESMTVHRPGVVDVDGGGRIAWVGAGPQAPALAEGWTERRCDGLVMPGLVNVHCHSPMTLLRGQGDALPLATWLTDVIWPREARMDAEDVYRGMVLASAELLRYGVTTSVEMYFHHGALARAVDESGARCVMTPGVVVAPGWERFGGWQRQVDYVERMHARYRDHPRIDVGFGPHSAYTLPDEALRVVGQRARELGMMVHLHLAETEHEGDGVSARHGGASVPRVLADLGLFEGNHVLAAHGVWLSDPDIALLAGQDVAVAHCPGSNAKLASGIAPVGDLRAAGIPVGLGTDGPASNNDLDLWEELRFAALLARLTGRDPTALSAADALGMATRGGAAALGRDDLGVLAPGRWADMLRIDVSDPAFVPVLGPDDLIAHLVFSAPRQVIRDVWVAGEQVVADGSCLRVDVPAAATRAQRAAAALAVPDG